MAQHCWPAITAVWWSCLPKAHREDNRTSWICLDVSQGWAPGDLLSLSLNLQRWEKEVTSDMAGGHCTVPNRKLGPSSFKCPHLLSDGPSSLST